MRFILRRTVVECTLQPWHALLIWKAALCARNNYLWRFMIRGETMQPLQIFSVGSSLVCSSLGSVVDHSEPSTTPSVCHSGALGFSEPSLTWLQLPQSSAATRLNWHRCAKCFSHPPHADVLGVTVSSRRFVPAAVCASVSTSTRAFPY